MIISKITEKIKLSELEIKVLNNFYITYLKHLSKINNIWAVRENNENTKIKMVILNECQACPVKFFTNSKNLYKGYSLF